ncbi:MAG: 4Fe-4S dicluster domain-containing protein [Thermodesulfobacteriota bacterium]
MAADDIKVDEGLCAGCLRCALACSSLYTGEYNAELGRIRVEADGVQMKVWFTEECPNCGHCVGFCFYGALSQVGPETRS